MSTRVTGWCIAAGVLLAAGSASFAPPALADNASATGPIQVGDGADGIIQNGKPSARGWKSLFDGRTLKGWMGEKGYWEVKDGAIVGTQPPHAPHHHYMFSTKDYSDFLLHIDVKLVGYNSGVCIRIAPENYDSVPGYQVDMGDGFWGCLWEEHKRETRVFTYPKADADRILHKDDWNHYFVRAVGHHITIFLNGVKTADGDDPLGLLSGPLGFQLCHGGPEVASFRNIYIKTLKPPTKGTAPKPPAVVVP